MQPGEISAHQLESAFGGSAPRFASFCNAVLASKALSAALGYPVLSEKPGPDGSFDGEWTIAHSLAPCAGLAVGGWNVFQFKARGIDGGGRRAALAPLKRTLKGAARNVAMRLAKPDKNPSHYVLFTNLQLGLETATLTANNAELSKDRADLEAAIREDADPALRVTILDAADLAAAVNANAALRLTYFAGPIARTWEEKWAEEKGDIVNFFGRERDLKELTGFLADDAVRVIVITGPSGMGKTRLALEATRVDCVRTTVVDLPEEFERWPLGALAAATLPRIIIVEDPDEALARRLAKHASTQPRIKLIFTLSSVDAAPLLSFDDIEVKPWQLESLGSSDAERLLKAVNPNLSGELTDWILQSAGGIPFVIQNAAELGNELHGKIGSLKQRLAVRYQHKIETELDADAMEVLRLISPLQWAVISGEKSELELLLSIFGPAMGAGRAAHLLDRLNRMGFVRRRGNYATVMPPIFASYLAEGVFDTLPPAVRAWHDRTDDEGRRRLLERVVTLELRNATGFWNHVFQPFAQGPSAILQNTAMFHTLSRAAPERLAQILERNIAELIALGAASGARMPQELASAIRELVYYGPTCASGMRLLEALALAEPLEFPLRSAVSRFCDTFVHWLSPFPLSHEQRFSWMKRLVDAPSGKERQLGLLALVHATSIPHTLGGYTVTARRLGPPMRSPLWGELFDYLEHIFNLRLALTQETDESVSSLMSKDLAGALTRLEAQLPAEVAMRVLTRFMALYETQALTASAVEVRRLLEFYAKSFRETRNRAETDRQPVFDQMLIQLATWSRTFDEGPFLLRLRLAVAHVEDALEETIFEGRNMLQHDVNCRRLAHEAVDNPVLMSDEVWALCEGREAFAFHTFNFALGEYDLELVHLPVLERNARQRREGERNLALYLAGWRRRDQSAADQRLASLATDLKMPKTAVFAIMSHFGHTPQTRSLLRQWITSSTIPPRTLAEGIHRRSLDDDSPEDVRILMEYLLTEPATEPTVLAALSGYIYPDKPLPAPLLELGEKILRSRKGRSDMVRYDCSQIAISLARTDPERAYKLFHDQMAAVSAGGHLYQDELWNPLGRFDDHTFWEFFRRDSPARAYRELIEVPTSVLRNMFRPMLLLPTHLAPLTALASDAAVARKLASIAIGAQEGFFAFAYALLSLHPTDGDLRESLANTAITSDHGGFSGVDRYQDALVRIEKQTKDPATPAAHLSWVQLAREKALEAIAANQRAYASVELPPGWE